MSKKHDSYVLTLVAEVSLKDNSVMGTFHFGPGPDDEKKEVKKEELNEKVAFGKKVNRGAHGKSKKVHSINKN